MVVVKKCNIMVIAELYSFLNIPNKLVRILELQLPYGSNHLKYKLVKRKIRLVTSF